MRCDVCDFDYETRSPHDAAHHIVTAAEAVAARLVDGRDPTIRPAPEVWSPLEYGCHLRDVLLTQRERVLLALREDVPVPPSMGRDERAVHDGYAHQSHVDVARQLVDASTMFANVLTHLGAEQWERRLVYGYPEPAERSIAWVAVHTEHEAVHHLRDVG